MLLARFYRRPASGLLSTCSDYIVKINRFRPYSCRQTINRSLFKAGVRLYGCLMHLCLPPNTSDAFTGDLYYI